MNTRTALRHLLPLLLPLLLLLSACGQAPTAPPSPSPCPVPTPEPVSVEKYEGCLQISELMIRNRASLADTDGSFPDWVELENTGSRSLELEGFGLSNRADRICWRFPACSLGAGEYLLVFCGEGRTGFSLKEGDNLFLSSPDGSLLDSAVCSGGRDRSLARQPDGSFRETAWISPGYPNDNAGYESYCLSRSVSGFCLWEASAAGGMAYGWEDGGSESDWVELRNTGEAPLDLTGFTLSDTLSRPDRWSFPQRELGPGELLLLRCDGDRAPSEENTGFSLNASGEALYLFGPDGALRDYLCIHDLPAGGSIGRMDGSSGFYFFALASPGSENLDGLRRVAAAPLALTPDGCYEGVDRLEAALSAPGEIRYTLDGTLPDVDSPLYQEPLTLEGTTILRAVALEEGALPSPVVSYSYFLNEGGTLPVLSLVVDDAETFRVMYLYGDKSRELSANLALYDGEHSFNRRCALGMKGWTSLGMPKKSLGVRFRGEYGGDLDCDVFGNGIRDYASLSIRAGQDSSNTIFRNELVQELALETEGRVLTQESKFCTLYLNGEYRGIYCLKEDFSRQYYASHAGVSKRSVEMQRTPAPFGSPFYDEVVIFAKTHDLSNDEYYQVLCDRIDMDSLIDWFLFEAWCANTDIQGNTRVFRSPENGGKWVFALYDLDWAFYYEGSDFTVFLLEAGNCGNQLPPLINGLLRHPDFRARCLTRFGELNRGILSNTHVLEKIDQLEALLSPEVPRDREYWDLKLSSWSSHVEQLRRFLIDLNWEQHNRDQLIRLLRLTEEEQELYFGG